MAEPFFGMRGTGDWPADYRPENWREMIMYLYPNGQTPLTAVMSMTSGEVTDDPVFHWTERDLPTQAGTVAGVFTDAALATPYAGGGAADDVVFAQVAQAVAEEFRIGHQVLFELVAEGSTPGDPRHEVQGEVVSRLLAGASSYIGVKLHETPNASFDLDVVNYLSVTGNLNAEGATMPDPISYNPEEAFNHTQIFRTSLSLTRTARKTRLRYGSPAYEIAKAEALELHAIEMEKAAIRGRRWEGRGSNNQPKRTSRGLVESITSSAPENVFDFRYDTTVTAGATWEAEGEEWLTAKLGQVFVNGSDEKMGLMGYGAGQGIARLMQAGSEFNITSQTRSYGFRVNEWVLSNGVVGLKTHPLFSKWPNYQNTMIVFEPSRIRWRYIDDTEFYDDPPGTSNKARNNRKDATEEEFLTEGGWEHHHASTGAVFYGIGEDNAL